MRFGSWRGSRLALLLAAGLAVGAAACGPTQPTTSASSMASSSASASAPSSASSPATASLPAPAASSTVGSPPALPAGVTVDPGLLEVLPAQIDGVTLEPDPTTALEVASDLLLAESALSIAVALAVAPASFGSEDLAVASVIRLRPDVFDVAFYQEWRDTYNEAACEVAGGVEGEAETEIGGRATYVGTCVGGAQTYHTYLGEQGFIISITATGERRYGERILACAPGVALPCR